MCLRMAIGSSPQTARQLIAIASEWLAEAAGCDSASDRVVWQESWEDHHRIYPTEKPATFNRLIGSEYPPGEV